MPVNITTDPSRDLTVLTVVGIVRLPELTAALNAYGAKGPTRNEIYDIRVLSGERLSSDDINALTDYFKRFTPDRRPAGSRTAIVVAQDVDYGLARMIALLTEDAVPFHTAIFHTLQAAEDWLDGA